MAGVPISVQVQTSNSCRLGRVGSNTTIPITVRIIPRGTKETALFTILNPTPLAVGDGSGGGRSALGVVRGWELTVSTGSTKTLSLGGDDSEDAVEDVDWGTLALGGRTITWLAELALGLLAGLLGMDETGVGDWEEGPTAVGADLSSVA